ncbi:unnamed protein product [Mytilus coruscus]|uniref:Uncharacterized protein n=1 Tax=Mytilus coruscus TaxID=42192 RepID=A0A6J8E258_MYTCO|nr:unnamed protein product [Mytilus coruscus]
MSIALYRYMCQEIIGTEEQVKTIRMMNNIRDYLNSSNNFITITSGSFGDGLEMRGSDLDIMLVLKYIEVSEEVNIHFITDTIYFTMASEDTSPGFTKLRLLHNNDQSILEDCDEFGHDYYFSNASVKRRNLTDIFSLVHGPCVSDKEGIFDFAFCVRSKAWITQANQWITRSNNGWPDYDVKQSITKHGIPNFCDLSYEIRRKTTLFHVLGFHKLTSPSMEVGGKIPQNVLLERFIRKVLSIKSSKIKYLYTYYFSKLGGQELLPFVDASGNKSSYKHYNTNISTLLQSTRHDAVSGWLLLASLFYKTKEYTKSVDVLNYCILICTPEKLYRDELQIEAETGKFFISPVVYAHFLSFLCHFHLKNTRRYHACIQELQSIIEENCCIINSIQKAIAYNTLGICLQLIGDIGSAKQAFLQSTEIF